MTLPRFYPILDTGVCERKKLPLDSAARAILEAGVRILQIRHKGHFSRDLFAACESIAAMCDEAGALFVINDRADIAALLNAGLHLGQEDLPAVEARRIAPAAVIGFSTHNEGQLHAAADLPADYLAIGPIFGTASKENPDPVVGLGELKRLRPLTSKPLVAIGGITRANADQVFTAGADSVAIIGDLYDGVGNAPDLRNRCEEFLRL